MKKFTFKLWATLFFGAAVFFATSCKKDKDNDDDGNPGGNTSAAYTLSLRSDGDADVSTDYLINVPDLMSGEITIVGNGIEQSGYHFYQQTGPYLTTITYTDANTATVYKLDANKQLTDHLQFSIGRTHLYHPVDDKNFIAMNIPRGGSENATFYQVNVETGTVNEKATSVFTPTRGSGEQAYFSGMTIRGNQLFVPFFQIASSAFDSEMTDSAYMAIYSYPGLDYQGVVTDPRTGPIGAYASQGHIFTTETNDIYTASPCSYSTGASKQTRPSGILRIKAGESTFDRGYFFNIEEASGGYKLCNTHYLGNNKVLASIFSFIEHTEDDKWSRRDVKLAIIDVVEQTISYINGVPVHYGGPTGMYANQLMEKDGKVYIKISNADGIYIYEVDPATLTGRRGAKIVATAEVYGFFNLD